MSVESVEKSPRSIAQKNGVVNSNIMSGDALCLVELVRIRKANMEAELPLVSVTGYKDRSHLAGNYTGQRDGLFFLQERRTSGGGHRFPTLGGVPAGSRSRTL